MKPDGKYSQPLKGIVAKQPMSGSKRAAILFGLCALAVMPFVAFYVDFSNSGRGQSSIDPPKHSTDVIATNTAEVNENTVSNEVTNTIPSRGQKLDPAGGDFQEVEPDGELVAVVPKPKPAPVKRRQEVSLAHLPDTDVTERGTFGALPKISADGLRPMDVYSRPPDTEGNFGVARVVIVIGGMGISQTTTNDAIKKLPSGVTLAFAPYGNSLLRWMQKARRSGHELLLQMPMEPVDFPNSNPGKHTLLALADFGENRQNMHWIMSRLTNYVGVTNYMGSKILRQPASLSPVFGEISRRGLLFFEDGSVKNSVGEGVAVKELLPYARANIQIDNVRSRQAIAAKLKKLSSEAKRTGLAIGMGNAFPDTIEMVAKFAREAKRIGIEITPVSAIVKDPNR